jgi:hypothetical protein
LLKAWLSQLYPLLQPPIGALNGLGELRQLTYFNIMDALSALDAGEVRPVFAPNAGKNRRANRYSLARAKIEALMWKKRLVCLGFREKDARYEITVAFGEQWDTIRKWEKQCTDILGALHVRSSLLFAGSAGDPCVQPVQIKGLFGNRKPLNPLYSVKAAGDAYREEVRRSAELSKRKSRPAADE